MASVSRTGGRAGGNRYLRWPIGQSAEEQERDSRRQEVSRCSAQYCRPNPEVANQEPRRHQGSEARSHQVHCVQGPDDDAGLFGIVDEGADKERERRSHEKGGRQQRAKVQEARRPGITVQVGLVQVQPVVIERAARCAEERDRDLDGREQAERLAGGHTCADHPAGVAADAEARHERAHDHGDRVDADAAMKGEDPLPGHLVDERRSATEEERGAHQEDSPQPHLMPRPLFRIHGLVIGGWNEPALARRKDSWASIPAQDRAGSFSEGRLGWGGRRAPQEQIMLRVAHGTLRTRPHAWH